MKLKQNSTTSKLYRWFYSTGSMPQNLCPYFWKLVVMWLLILPYAIISLPYQIIMGKDNQDDTTTHKFVAGAIMWFVLWLGLSMLFCVSLFWISFEKDTFLGTSQGVGVMCWIIAVGFGGWELGKWVRERREDRKASKYVLDDNGNWVRSINEKKPSIIVEFVKAKYNKYCPKIDWE